MLSSLMMDRPLQLRMVLWRAERLFGDKEIVSRQDGGCHRYTYAEYTRRVRRLASALRDLGVGPRDRVGTLAWNTHQHLESYLAVPCMGAVLHTINPRLSADQIVYIINHAGDRVLLVSSDQLPLLERIWSRLSTVTACVVLDDNPVGSQARSTVSPLLDYEELLGGAHDEFEFPDLDEETPAGMCYTSGTTGNPKGVVYSHRSMVLHTLMLCLHGSIGVAEGETFLVVVPMSHVNSWGIPYACLLQGAKLVLPGVHPEPADHLRLIAGEEVSICVAAVTVGTLMREVLEQDRPDYALDSLRLLWLGGQAPPQSLMRWWDDHYGVTVVQAWGMTEASPLLTFTQPKSKFAGTEPERRYEVMGKQGLPMPLVELKVVDERGREQPWDGCSPGELLARSPWVARSYYDDSRSGDAFEGGWFRTGDVGTIDEDGYVALVDRTKDLIKSGGEWVSSIDLENALMAHPRVREAVVIGVADQRWLERPLACVVAKGALSRADLRSYLAQRFPKFWVPDQVVFVEQIPKTGVGKFDKKRLRTGYGQAGVDGIVRIASAAGDGGRS